MEHALAGDRLRQRRDLGKALRWRRLRDWQQAGVWQRLLQALQNKLGRGGRIDWSRASLDYASVPAKRGAKTPAPTQ